MEETLNWHTEQRRVKDLIPWDKNPRTLTEPQKKQLLESLGKFNLVEIPAINLDNKIVAGHQRVFCLTLEGRGDEMIDVRVPNRLMTEEEFTEYNIRSNKNTGEWNWERLATLERDLIARLGFDPKELGKMLTPDQKKEKARQTLAARFIVPPFSVLDSRQGVWQQRKKAWMELTGVLSETRENVLYKTNTGADVNFYNKKRAFERFLGRELTNEEFEESYYVPAFVNAGVSVFDPVLCEVLYTWFGKKKGERTRILDPFMGGATRPFVAAELGMEYTGIDVRKDQVEANAKSVHNKPGINLIHGDSNNLSSLVTDTGYDLIFTCPPYYDLEVYSKEDMSSLGTYDEFMTQYKNIFRQAVEKLKDGSFLVIIIGEIRNKKTGEYRNFLGDNIRTFQELGLHYHNEMVLITSTGNLGVRSPRQFNDSRKIGKTHQNILTFYKGQADKLFNEHHAILSTHQSVLTFFKGDMGKISDIFGPVIPQIDMEIAQAEEGRGE